MLHFKPFPSATLIFTPEPGPSLPPSIATKGEGCWCETSIKKKVVVIKTH